MREFGENSEKRGLVRNTVHKLGLQMRRSESYYQSKIDYYEKIHRELLDQAKLLENENRELAESLGRSSKEFAALRRKYYSLNDQLQRGRRQNEKLAETLPIPKPEDVGDSRSFFDRMRDFLG